MTPLESLTITGDSRSATFQTRLDQGELFLLKASGAVYFDGETIDAEYDRHGEDVAKGMDIGIDVGRRALRPAPGAAPARMHWFGSYSANHTYYIIVTGDGGPLSMTLVAPKSLDEGGAITVSLYRLSGVKSQLPAPLETLAVPVLQKIVPTIMSTRKSTVYLLQCAGQGRVGGGGIGMGDADYMDYNADGSGQVDIGDGNTDYGLGVDEADLSKSPRTHWWGPWRQDHTYDMLFEGTGAPIHFMFYDVAGGYGDNSATDTLTVGVYALP